MPRWRIGNVEIETIIETDLTGILDVVIPEANRVAVKQIRWLMPHFADANGVMSGYIQAFAIRTPTRRIVVDTCLGNDKDRDSVLPAWSRLQTNFLERLAMAGFPPDEVDTVLCTHMHLDHVGWNTRLVNGCWVRAVIPERNDRRTGPSDRAPRDRTRSSCGSSAGLCSTSRLPVNLKPRDSMSLRANASSMRCSVCAAELEPVPAIAE